MPLTTAAHALLMVVLVAALPVPALAAKAIVVGSGTPASCTEAALKSALQVAEAVGGGLIQFKCGRQPVSIALSGVTEVAGMLVLLVLPNNTAIDGGGLITLDGTDSATVVFVEAGTNAALHRLAITNGRGPERFDQSSPGGIANLGTLAITKSTVSDNVSCCGGRGVGGIWNTGILTIDDSEVSDNFGVFGGAMVNEGTLTIRATTFADNGNVDASGGIYNTGTLDIINSAFLRNDSLDGFSGAIANTGTLTVTRSLFAENFAFRSGGGILNFGTLNIEQSAFIQNSIIFGEGGGLSSWGELTVKNSIVSGNSAGFDGGGIFTAGALAVENSIITQNRASAGGGIYVCVDEPFCEGTLSLKRTIVTGNAPDDIFP